MQNTDIRDAIRRAGFLNYEVAAALGLSESNFSRRLRANLTEEEKTEILESINKMYQERDLCRNQ